MRPQRTRVPAASPGNEPAGGQTFSPRPSGSDREQERISASAFAAEQARWNSEARFRAVFAESVIGIGDADTEGTILAVNQALWEMLGYRTEELLRHPIWELIHPGGDSPGVWEQVKRLLSGATDHVWLEPADHRKDGAEIWTDLVLSLVRDPQGRPRLVGAEPAVAALIDHARHEITDGQHRSPFSP